MGDLSKIRINGTLYDLKDATARQEVAQCVNNGTYDSNSKKILLKHDNTVVVQIDATDFIKDGMVSNVVIQNGNLVITFNTDAGQEPIVIPLTDIFNPNNYYTKSQVDNIVPVDVIRTQSDATFVNSGNQPVFYLRQATSSLAGLMTAAEHTKLSDLPSNSELTQTLNGKVGIVDNGAYDVTVHNSNATFASLQALLNSDNLSTLIPTDVRKGGMSIKFVQSSDNKYVQYRCMAQNFTTDTTQWAIAEEGVYIENPEFAYVFTDTKNRIVWAIKTNADIYYGAGVPQQIKDYIEEKISSLSLDEYEDIVAFLSDYLGSDTTLKALMDSKLDAEGLDIDALQSEQTVENNEYIEATTDSKDRVLEGITSEEEKQINIPVDTPSAKINHIDNPEWIDATTDKNNKICEGLNVNGEKFIGKFDNNTKEMIKGFASLPSLINIPQLDANFTSPAPVTVIGTKGDKNAMYVFDLNVQEKANIRFKFKIIDNLINLNRSAQIARFDTAPIVANIVSIYQYSKRMSISGETVNVKYPTVGGGIRFMEDTDYSEYDFPFAFYIRYIGESTNVKIKNDGTALTLKVEDVTYTYTLADYNSMYELYAALKENNLFEIKYKELEGHTCDELLKFPECSMINTYYSEGNDHTVYENASAPFFVPYARDMKWHQVEIIKNDDTLYLTVDGHAFETHTYNGDNTLTLGGACGVIFKDVEISIDSMLDAEIVNNYIISSASPCLIVYNGHGMFDKPQDELDGSSPYSEEGMGTSVDRLYYVFRAAIEKGYVPVSVDDITSYYIGEKTIPKRSFIIFFDDFRYYNCLNLDFRKVFSELEIHPALSIIYSTQQEIIFDGEPITKKEASEICLRNGFQLVNHLDHVPVTVTNPALLMDKLKNDIIECDKILVDGMTIVYPSGWIDKYVMDTLKFLGCKCGVIGAGQPKNNPLWINRYFIKEVEIGARVSLQSIMDNLL